ncbi:MAG: hypothetical protein Phog2KO_39690 [Phototrophicaceae bacterium]
MTQVNINPETAQKLKQLSQQTEKSLDEVLDLLLSRYSDTLITDDNDEVVEVVEDVTWTDEEIEDLLTMKEPLSSKEIVKRNLLGGWADEGITDGLEWVKQQRANRRKKLQW